MVETRQGLTPELSERGPEWETGSTAMTDAQQRSGLPLEIVAVWVLFLVIMAVTLFNWKYGNSAAE